MLFVFNEEKSCLNRKKKGKKKEKKIQFCYKSFNILVIFSPFSVLPFHLHTWKQSHKATRTVPHVPSRSVAVRVLNGGKKWIINNDLSTVALFSPSGIRFITDHLACESAVRKLVSLLAATNCFGDMDESVDEGQAEDIDVVFGIVEK